MSESKLQIKCPGCEKSLRIPATMQGKVVSCPACQTKLKIASVATAPTPASAAPAPPSNPPAVPNIQLPSEAGGPPAQVAAPLAAPPTLASPATGAPIPPAAPLAPLESDPLAANAANSNLGTPAWGAATAPKQTSKVNRKKKKQQPADDEEHTLSSIGYYLVVTAILASIAPLFGLEHRALRHAGEFGPIIGIVLGLVGSGMIATRGTGASMGIAGVCAVLSIGSGIFGYQFHRSQNDFASTSPQSSMSKAEKESARKEELARMKASNPLSPPPVNNNGPGFQVPGFNPAKPAANPGIPNVANRGNASASNAATDAMEESQRRMEEIRQNNADQVRRMEEMANRQMQDMANRGRSNLGSNRPPGFPGRPNIPGFNGGNGNRVGGPGSPRGNSPFGNSPFGRSPFGSSGNSTTGDSGGGGGGSNGGANVAEARLRSNLMQRENSGLNVMTFRARGNDDLNSNYRFEAMVGSENSFGQIFYQTSPLKGVLFADLDRHTFLLPTNDSDPADSEHCLHVPEGHALVGLNLSVTNGNLDGLQAIYAKPDEKRKGRFDLENTTTSDWIGNESNAPLSAMTKGKPAVGLVVFRDVQSITGLQLITRKSSR